MEPINYLAQVADPFVQSLQGLQLGAGMVELQQKQAAMVQQQQRQQLAAQEQAKFFTNPNPTMRDAARYASLLSPEQANAFRPFMEGISKEQQQGALNSTGRILSALQTRKLASNFCKIAPLPHATAVTTRTPLCLMTWPQQQQIQNVAQPLFSNLWQPVQQASQVQKNSLKTLTRA
jgi:hypothetical protein